MESVFNNMARILSRIEEIKSRFGGYPYNRINRESTGFEKTLNKQKQSGDENRVKSSEYNNSNKMPVEPSIETLLEGNNDQVFEKLENAVKLASQKYGLPEQLIKAVIEQESGYNPWAVSTKGALGLMQLMPSTAELLGVENPFDIYENVLGGVGYLKMLLDRYGGDLNKALAAYNAGPSKVKDSIPQIPETKKFIKSVIDSYEKYTNHFEGDEF